MSGIGPVMCRIKPVMSKIGLGNGNDVRPPPPYPLKNLVISDESKLVIYGKIM